MPSSTDGISGIVLSAEAAASNGAGSVAATAGSAKPMERPVRRRSHAPLEEEDRGPSYARSLLEASLDPLVTINPDGRITDANQATVTATEVSREQLIGSDFASYFTDPESARTGYRLAFEKGSVRDYELAIRSRSGSLVNVLYNASVYRDEAGAVAGVFAAARDITDRKRAEEAEARAVRAMRMLNACNEVMIHAAEETKLLEDTCRAIVDVGGYRLAWVGYAEVDEAKSVRPVSWAGFNGDYVQRAAISWAETDERGRGPTGQAIRTGKPIIARDTQAETNFAPWREEALHRGYRSSIAMPLQSSHQIYGALMVYSDRSDAFDTEETRLLSELADDLAFATGLLRTRAALERSEAEVSQLNAELERRVVERTAQLEAANRELEAFSYSVSHDLRVPLRAIDGFSRILLEDYADQFDVEGKRLINVVRDSTAKMGRLIDDILAFSRAGRTELRSSVVDMNSLVRAVLDDVLGQVSAGGKNIVDIAELPSTHGDRAMLERVWANLLDNAIKFSAPKPGSRIEVGSTSGDGETIYYVRDTGIGFDMLYVGKLFGVFQRLHGADIPGTGIGLAIVKRLVVRHGGRVWAEGEVGKGATFFFALPKRENVDGSQ